MTDNTGVPRQPTLLIILDGFGVNMSKQNNAVALANTPRLDEYFARYAHTHINASGDSVGLPDGQMGNSEVGHMTLGSGHVILQDMVQISRAIEAGSFFDNKALLASVRSARDRDRPVHLIGLVSDGGVHSHIDHLKALIQLCKQNGARPLLHMITDGRDTPPRSALVYLREIESVLHEAGGAIATIVGRYYAMDRDRRWERTEMAWRALMLGQGGKALSAESAIGSAYAKGDSDEFIRPIKLPASDDIIAGDEVVFFNYRKDRPRQLVAALGSDNFAGFDRGEMPLANVTCMMPYESSFSFPYAFEPQRPRTTLAREISRAGLSQFHCAETEKFSHITHFFNGGRDQPHSGEKRMLIPSPKVATYDQMPAMSAPRVADAVESAIRQNEYAFIVVNFANGDMVGHTAVADAVIDAVEVLDREVGRVLDAAIEAGYSVILTADHGNCEEMVDPVTGKPHTQHTTYPVPCMVIDRQHWKLTSSGELANIAPTVLQLMGLAVPAAMKSSLLLKPLPGSHKDPYQRAGLKVVA
ncbi:MAG: 2,3-bisphosphoglycerate-independent phosphoglycerate mutase [Thiotrichales bacterium]|nr:MAG: 2,3-bisphosphoglycerate-independent phosphoglycerate mutase [Thiotrichales bacterium]